MGLHVGVAVGDEVGSGVGAPVGDAVGWWVGAVVAIGRVCLCRLFACVSERLSLFVSVPFKFTALTLDSLCSRRSGAQDQQRAQADGDSGAADGSSHHQILRRRQTRHEVSEGRWDRPVGFKRSEIDATFRAQRIFSLLGSGVATLSSKP